MGLRAVDRALGAAFGRGPAVEPLFGFGGGSGKLFDGLSEEVSAEVPCVVEKDAAFLKWRYGPGSPPNPVTILGAVEMAEVALENAEHEEIRILAEDIVGAQEAEIEELRGIKREEFGTSEIPSAMAQGEMDAMGMTDPQELADKRPLDRAFIDAMMPHYRSAIAMAKVALKESDNQQTKGIARDIVDAQRRETGQMERWREQWSPQG
ncbi:DUF305 domain-containing protein [Rubrobacter tropicus]|uniref:DUF305 domain-containing protein n=1 Tax=Rubrobacter tropicus TaxID=2653851 RepID=UPI00140D5F35|nr:DUF305 domain-containing protein [Rubrobacter tropicus]